MPEFSLQAFINKQKVLKFHCPFCARQVSLLHFLNSRSTFDLPAFVEFYGLKAMIFRDISILRTIITKENIQ